jgi:hypothetical protein
MDVDNPDIVISSPWVNEWEVEIYPLTSLGLVHLNTTFWYFWTFVFTSKISFPVIDLIEAVIPPPFVPVLSNLALSPTL